MSGNSKINEQLRIQKVYGQRDASGLNNLYSWYRPEVRQQEAAFSRVFASLLTETIGQDLSNLKVLDVGCGTGKFLRLLVEWGALPVNLVGSEFLPDRLEDAKGKSHSHIKWHLGDIDDLPPKYRFDLISANTVFSSILEPSSRKRLATKMWARLKPGGYIMLFDFRYNNPKNSDVHKVTFQELQSYWEGESFIYRNLILAPPIGRFLTPHSFLLAEFITKFFPFLRSHFFFMISKPSC